MTVNGVHANTHPPTHPHPPVWDTECFHSNEWMKETPSPSSSEAWELEDMTLSFPSVPFDKPWTLPRTKQVDAKTHPSIHSLTGDNRTCTYVRYGT